MKKSLYTALAAVTALFVMAGAANAQALGTIFKKDGGKASGQIRYLPSSKMYEIKVGTISVRLNESEIYRLSIRKP